MVNILLYRAKPALKGFYIIIYAKMHEYDLILSGQHCSLPEKRHPYDTDIRVPLLVRGPGIIQGQRRNVSYKPKYQMSCKKLEKKT